MKKNTYGNIEDMLVRVKMVTAVGTVDRGIFFSFFFFSLIVKMVTAVGTVERGALFFLFSFRTYIYYCCTLLHLL